MSPNLTIDRRLDPDRDVRAWVAPVSQGQPAAATADHTGEAAPLTPPPARPQTSRWQRAAALLLAAIIVASGGFVWRGVDRTAAAQREVAQLMNARRALDALHQGMLDAETGQRGYLLKGHVDFLQPYHAALSRLPRLRAELQRQLPASLQTAGLIEPVQASTDAALQAMRGNVETRADPQAWARALSGMEQKVAMDRWRAAVDALQQPLDQMLQAALGVQAREVDIGRTQIVISLAVNASLMLALLAWMRRSSHDARRNAQSMQAHNLRLSQVLAESEDRVTRLRAVSDLARFLQGAANREEAMAILSQSLATHMHAHSGALYLYAASRNHLQLAFSWGPRSFTATLYPSECWGLRRGQAFSQSGRHGATRCAHLAEDATEPAAGADAERGCSLQCMPMAAHGELMGLLVIEAATAASEARAVTDARARQVVFEQVALSLSNLALRETLRHQSLRDPLTGLHNRRFLEEAAPRELQRAWRRRQQDPTHALAALMIDIDHFKRFNDEYGHEVGDRVLKAVGVALTEQAGASDIVVRLGGEEFAMLMPDLSADDALRRADELRQAIEGLPGDASGAARVTVSVGLALMPDDGGTLDELLRAADRCLYAAKRAGRNRVVAAAGTAAAAAQPAEPPVAA